MTFPAASRRAPPHHYKRSKPPLTPLAPTIRFSVKSRGNPSLRLLLARRGCSFDGTNGGELYRVLQAGGPDKIIFAGVGKSDEEVLMSPQADIAAVDIESDAEPQTIDSIAGATDPAAVGTLWGWAIRASV